MGRRKKVRTGSDRSPVRAVSAEELTQSESLRESSWEQLGCVSETEGEEERVRGGEREKGREGGEVRGRSYMSQNRYVLDSHLHCR